ADGDGADDHNGRPTETVTCSPASGSKFPLGKTTVNCTASNGATGHFDVTVVDTTAPALDVPRDFTVEATEPDGAVVTFNAKATDIVDGDVAVTCSPASGSKFPVGKTKVQCSASDTRNNGASADFQIEVTPPQPPPPPPPDPDDITAEATGPNGAIVTFNGNGTGGDDHNGRPTSGCTPASGSLFPLGTTAVQCSGGVTFDVIVVDTTAPALTVPDDMTVVATSSAGAVVTFNATANDLVDGGVAVSCNPPSGSTFPLGQTNVVCSASDSRNNGASAMFVVTVTDTPPPDDTEAPVIVSISANPNVLSPPNGKLVDVTVTVEVTDNLDPAPVVRVFDVTANETIGNDDWAISSDLVVALRAARDPQGTGRVYTVHVEAIDAAGNRSTSSVNVTVPHDQSGNTTVPQKKGKRRAV
ncbi:MAG: HYR domain-containing protein, partial [Thermoanaerobaculia bacterium]